jgi:hypothetical protein
MSIEQEFYRKKYTVGGQKGESKPSEPKIKMVVNFLEFYMQ